MLKHMIAFVIVPMALQPPSGGCVLKPLSAHAELADGIQPPSGGCVLKLSIQCSGSGRSPSRLQAAVC